MNICGDEGFVVRHKRWAGTAENFDTGGAFVHPEHPPDPNLPANSIEGPALAFRDGAGTDLSAFDLLALVAEPIADAHPPVPPSCDVEEAILNGAAATACTLNSECQGNRTCGSGGTCAGFAGAACCAHVSPGACLATDGYCNREKQWPRTRSPLPYNSSSRVGFVLVAPRTPRLGPSVTHRFVPPDTPMPLGPRRPNTRLVHARDLHPHSVGVWSWHAVCLVGLDLRHDLTWA